MDPADKVCSVEEVEEAVQVIFVKYKEPARSVALKEFSLSPGLAKQLPGVAEELTSTLVSLQHASIQPAPLPANPQPISLSASLQPVSLAASIQPHVVH